MANGPERGLTLVGIDALRDDRGRRGVGNGRYGTVFALTLPTSTLAWANSGGGSWSLPGNWNGNQVPGGSTPDTVTFGNAIGSSTATVTLDGNWAVGSLTFNTSGGGSYTIACSAGDTTSTLMLTGSVTNSGGNHTIAAPVVLGSNVMVSTTAGSSLTISGPISESAVGSSLTKTGAGALVLAGTQHLQRRHGSRRRHSGGRQRHQWLGHRQRQRHPERRNPGQRHQRRLDLRQPCRRAPAPRPSPPAASARSAR